jgi:23S rRNA G2069 N7-methylase RlmK/C1962 C5-methylase RlmI
MVADIALDRRIVWDAARLKEIDEAKKMIMDYRRSGYVVLKSDGTPMERFHPSLQEVLIKALKTTRRVMKILDVNGDTRITWDKENGKEALEAKQKFEDLLKQGYKAYSVTASGNKGRRIEEFDVDAQEILMIPETRKG